LARNSLVEKFVVENPAVAVAIIGALAGLIYLLVRVMLKHLETRINLIEEEVDHQRTNYTAKFKEVNDKIDLGNEALRNKIDLNDKELHSKIEDSNRIILQAISTIKLDVQRAVDAVDKQVAICKTIQKLKDQ
jgi:F0F1-type ATP synthase membrane subunit b/b'